MAAVPGKDIKIIFEEKTILVDGDWEIKSLPTPDTTESINMSALSRVIISGCGISKAMLNASGRHVRLDREPAEGITSAGRSRRLS